MEENMIEISDLVKEYKMFARKKDRLLETVFPNMCCKHSTFKAINNLNLTVKKGEVLGILGKNGAGKSTLLKMITGVVVPTSGTLKVNGKISSLLELGAAFNPDLTGIENIYQHGQVMGLTNEQIEMKKQEIINFADIGEHLYQPVKTYSSGMFARLAFACAINVDPEILIVDEVLSVGDMAFQLKCFKKFEEFKKQNKTILFVTHGISDVMKNCTRTIIMENGCKIFDGDVKEGVDKYKKIMVGISDYYNDSDDNDSENKDDNLKIEVKDTDEWKHNFINNPDMVNYGNNDAEVIDYGMFNSNGVPINAFDNDEVVIFKSKIKFNKDVKDPIFTMTIKDFQGHDITGTNTDIEKIITGEYKAGDIVIVEFKQKVPIAVGKYTLSFSCTRFNLAGELEVLDRKYDALLIEVMSTKNIVGITRINSNIKLTKI